MRHRALLGREIQRLGHRSEIDSPRFVTPYRKSDKNDFNDAEAVAEAMSRPTMRFVELKSLAQQDMQSLHQARRLLIKQRTQSANQLRGSLAEYGVIAPRAECAAPGGGGAKRRAAAGDAAGQVALARPWSCWQRSKASARDHAIQQACRSDERAAAG